jgi:hypothetical protein
MVRKKHLIAAANLTGLVDYADDDVHIDGQAVEHYTTPRWSWLWLWSWLV